MIAYSEGSSRFNFRVAGVCIHDGHVLLHKEAREDFWALPGGRPRFHEISRETLIREMDEEIATRVAIERLLWVVENFFVYGGERWHELAFYYVMSLPETSPYRDVERAFTGSEEELTLYFRWFALVEIAAVNLYPTFLREGLRALPDATTHLVHFDEQAKPAG